MADYGDIGLAVGDGGSFQGAHQVVDLLGIPDADHGFLMDADLPRWAGDMFAWEMPNSQAVGVLTGATALAKIILIRQGCFAGYYSADQNGECVFRRLDYGDYLAVQYGTVLGEWDVLSTEAGITVTARNAASYPSIPLGNRLLVLAGGKIKAIAPA